MIRSRAQWFDEGERPTKFFCALENRNFLDKTIKKINDSSNNIITDQKSILETIKEYYSKLFQNHDADLDKPALEEFFKNENPTKLSDNKRDSIEGELTLSEIGQALKNMKNDKSPGLDGYSSEFLKFFWSKLKYYILRAINHSY